MRLFGSSGRLKWKWPNPSTLYVAETRKPTLMRYHKPSYLSPSSTNERVLNQILENLLIPHGQVPKLIVIVIVSAIPATRRRLRSLLRLYSCPCACALSLGCVKKERTRKLIKSQKCRFLCHSSNLYLRLPNLHNVPAGRKAVGGWVWDRIQRWAHNIASNVFLRNVIFHRNVLFFVNLFCLVFLSTCCITIPIIITHNQQGVEKRERARAESHQDHW